LYLQTQKNEIEVSLKYGIALAFQSVLGVVAMLFSSIMTISKTKCASLRLFSLLYPQTQKNEIKVSLKYGIALMFQSVH